MGIISEAQRAFPQAKIPHEEEYYRTVIAACAEIYKGEPPWTYVKRSGLYGKGERRMSMLGGAKVLCDSLAALTFSSQADIYCADHRQQELVERVLQDNGFWENMPSFSAVLMRWAEVRSRFSLTGTLASTTYRRTALFLLAASAAA